MGIKIAVHDNEEGDKTVNLVNKGSMGQYRRWKREHAIQALQDKTLNKKPEVRMTEHSNKTRAQSVVQIVEILGFGGPSAHMKSADIMARVIGRAGFHVTIRPHSDGQGADLIAKSTQDNASFALEVLPQHNTTIIRNLQYATIADREMLLKGFHAVRLMTPIGTKIVPNYRAIGPKGEDVLHSFQREVPASMWASPAESLHILSDLQERPAFAEPTTPSSFTTRFGTYTTSTFKPPVPGEHPTMTTRQQQRRQQYAGAAASSPWVQHARGQNNSHQVHPDDVIGGQYPQKFHDWAGSQFAGDSLARMTAEEQNTLYKHWLSIGQPAVGQAHHAQPQSHAGYALDPQDYTGPRLQGLPSSTNYYNQGFDPWSMMNPQSDTHHDPWHSSRGVETGHHVGYTPVQDIGGGRIRPTMPTPGESHPGTYQAHLAPTAEYPEPQSPDRPGVADPRLSAPDPAQQTGRIPQSEKTHRMVAGYPWGVNNPAVQRIVNALHGFGGSTVKKPEDKGKFGILISTADHNVSMSLHRSGRSQRTGKYKGMLVFEYVNPHVAHQFFQLIPSLLFSNQQATRSYPIYWENTFVPLVSNLRAQAPELLPELAAVFDHLPTKYKGNTRTGEIKKAIKSMKR